MSSPAYCSRARDDSLQASLLATGLISAPAMVDAPAIVSAICVFLLAMVPVYFRLQSNSAAALSEPIFPLGVVWILAVSLPIFLPWRYEHDATWRSVDPKTIETAALWMFRGFAALCFAYWGMRAASPPPTEDSDDDHGLRRRFFMLVGLAGVIGSAVTLLVNKGQVYTFVQGANTGGNTLANQIAALFQLFNYAYIYLYARDHQGAGRRSTEFTLLVVVLALHTVFTVAAGTKTAILAAGACWLLGTVTRPREDRSLVREFALIAAAGAFAFFASAVVTAYRFEVLLRQVPKDAPFLEVVGFQFDSFIAGIDNLLHGRGQAYRSSDLMARFGHVASFAKVLQYTGGQSPHENGAATFLTPFYAVFPRIWLEKPVFMGSGQFASMIGWKFGGYSLSIPGSIYWAWGFLGIPFAMGCLGAVLGWLAGLARSASANRPVIEVTLLLTVVVLLDVGGEFQAIVMTGIRYWLLAALLYWIAKQRPWQLGRAA